ASEDPAERIFLARVVGEVALPYVYQPLPALLADPEATVRCAALEAAGQIQHPRLLPAVIANLDRRATQSAATEALVAFGELLLPEVEKALGSKTLTEAEIARLVRICRQIKGEKVITLMRRNLDYTSTKVRDQILIVLSACHFQAQAADLPALNRALLRDAGRAHFLLVAQEDLGPSDALTMLLHALDDELTLAKKRVFWLLSFIYDGRAILQAQTRLNSGTLAQRALALEMLEVTLNADHKSLLLPLVDPQLERPQRIQMLNKRFKTPGLDRDRRLQKFVSGDESAWIRSCAIYGATLLGVVSQLDKEEMVALVEETLQDIRPLVRETTVWSLNKLAPSRFNKRLEELLNDDDPHVAQLSAYLNAQQLD
ncbi:MAG: HEAT repeat domain-containing protein, partial [Candidatus Promineifilaceae bacterium]|nr:HEAT repeat domain-containing protein [Candidatus Promineifilaceae bacterium]